MAKAFFSNISPREQLGKLIEDVANSGVKELKSSDVKEFKNLCKNGDDDLIDFVYRMFVMQLEKNHCQKRYSTMLLIEELFPRSHRFRSVFTDQANLKKFFELTLGTDKEKPLPKPKAFAKMLKEKVHQLVKEWIIGFGKGYPYLEQIYKLALSLTLPANQMIDQENDQPDVHHSINHRLDQETERELRLIDRIDRKLIEYSALESQLPELLEQVRNCFDLIIPKDEFSFYQMKDNQEIDHEISRLKSSSIVKQQVSITLKPYIEIHVNENNVDAIAILKELYKQLVSNYLVQIKSLLKHLSKAGKRCENEVKQLIRFKNQVLKLISMYSELKFVDQNDSDVEEQFEDKSNSNDESSTDDDDFEEVEEKDIEAEIPPERWTEYGIENPFITQYDPDRPSTSGLNNLVNYDSKACNVKMANGNLCQRKDKEKCPFHVQIIERDADGNALDTKVREEEENERKRKENDWQDPTYLKELENQLGVDLTIKKTKVKKNPQLLNLKTCDETPKSRLIKRIKTLKKYSI